MDDHTGGKCRAVGMGGDSLLLIDRAHPKGWGRPDYFGRGFTMAEPRLFYREEGESPTVDIAAGFNHDDARHLALCWNEYPETKRQRDALLAAMKHARMNLLGFESLDADGVRFKLRVVNNVIIKAIADCEADND